MNNRGIQTIFLPECINKKYTEKIDKINVFVNNELLNSNDNFNLPYNKNRLKFEILAPSLINYRDITYHYRINTIDTNWNINSYNNNMIDYKVLPPGNYTFEIKLFVKDQLIDKQSIHFIIAFPFWKTNWFFFLTIAFIAVIFYLIYKYRINLIEKKNREFLEKEKLKNELLSSKLTKLRAQMNPHFIFNSLNAIQELVLKQDADKSYDYIVLFSQLVRSILNNSEKDYISIENEIEFLEIYLKLEKLRFNKDFKYNLKCETDKQHIIPSFFIQPYIENALLHGLLHKEGKKILNIHFYEVIDFIICEIEDNGVGREESGRINKEKRKGHHSFSSRATEERAKMFTKRTGVKFSISITDKYDEKGHPIGTKVTINFPKDL